MPIIERYADFLPQENPDEALEVLIRIGENELAPNLSRVEAEIIASVQAN
jgi:hypothetical protein